MKILVIHGSPRKNGNTVNISNEFIEHLKSILPDLDICIYFLTENNILSCKGCFNCLRKGIQHCPLNDDINSLYKDMKDSDGIILTSPTYIMHVSSQMKEFLDRFSSLCHRPEFYYHHGLSITTTGGIGEKTSGKYLRDVLTIWGCQSSDMLALKTPPNNSFGTNSISDHIKIIHKKAEDFAIQLQSSKAPQPSFSQLMQFRMQKKLFTQQDTKELFPEDYHFWSNRPYKSYHVKARINPVFNAIAFIFEKIMAPFI